MMMDFRGAWQDGQAGSSWLAGLHIAEWVEHYPKLRIVVILINNTVLLIPDHNR